MPIFLHPLDIRILLAHFESYSDFPNTITVRVEASTEGSIDSDLRRRCKYLAHMPESANVVFVEADLRDVVSEETLRTFEAPLRARTSKRRERGRKEDRARARAENQERERLRLPPPSSSPAWAGNTADYDLAAAIAATSVDHSPSPSRQHADHAPPENSGGSIASSAPVPLSASPPASGAWGQRSFASAAQRGTGRGQPARIHREPIEDEWDVDAEWHELRGGGRRKRVNKMMVLGGGGRRR